MKPNKEKLALWLADRLRKLTDSTYGFLEKHLNEKTLKKIDSFKPLPFCSLYINLRQPIPEHFIGHAVYTISQDAFRFRNDDGSESAATWIAAENTNWEPTLTGSNQAFRLRMMCQEIGGTTGTSSFLLQFSQDGGTWTTITTSTSPVRIRATSFVTDGAATTDQIGGTGTFDSAPFRETNTSSSVNHSASGHSEHEWSLELLSTFTGGTINFRLYRTESNAPPSSITQTPTLFSPIMINSIEDLNNIRNNVSGTIIVGNFKLARDLDFNDDASYDNPANKSTYTTGAGWVALGSTGNPWFGASIDGDGHTISNLMCNASTTGVSNAGFIGVMDAPAAGQTIIIENLGLINPMINANATNSAFNQCGALIMGIDPAGNNIIRNCFVRGGTVIGGSGSGNNGTGGLIGISHEYSGGSVLIQDCYVEDTVIYRNGASPGSNNGVGGLVGTFNILTSGSGSFLNITDCYASAASIGGDSTLNRGGLIGYEDTTTTYTTSYYNSTLTPYAGAGGTAKTDANMKTYTQFSSVWSIANGYDNLTTETWWINNGSDYPRLYYEVPSIPSFTTTHTTDALKKKATTQTHTTSSNKKKANNTLTHTTSANLVDSVWTYEDAVTLPANDNLLANSYNDTDRSNVATNDNVFKDLEGSGNLIEQVWLYHTNNVDEITPTWSGKSTLAPSSSTVYLQIYNHNTDTWTTLDFNSATAADTEFTLTGSQTDNLSQYYDTGNRVALRIYQEVV